MLTPQQLIHALTVLLAETAIARDQALTENATLKQALEQLSESINDHTSCQQNAAVLEDRIAQLTATNSRAMQWLANERGVPVEVATADLREVMDKEREDGTTVTG